MRVDERHLFMLHCLRKLCDKRPWHGLDTQVPHAYQFVSVPSSQQREPSKVLGSQGGRTSLVGWQQPMAAAIG